MKTLKKIPMFGRIIIGFAVGIILGLIFREKAAVLEPVGSLFMRMLKMLILPLVFSAIVSGLTSIPDMKKIYRMAVKAFILFIVMTALAILTGMVFGNLFKPGVGASIVMPVTESVETTDVSFISTILNMFPQIS